MKLRMPFPEAKLPIRLFFCIHSLILLLLIYANPGLATVTYRQYRHELLEADNRATKYENFNPARANPMRNLTCLGNVLHLRLPIIAGGFDPNPISLQKLCAKPQYNGGNPDQHAGGYCTEPPHEGLTGEVAFDRSPGARANTALLNPRVMLACRYRCFCNYGVADTSVQPKTKLRVGQFDVRRRSSESTYQLQMDIDDDFTTSRQAKQGQFERSDVDAVRLLTQSQLSRETGFMQRQQNMYQYVSLDPGNKIFCSGNMPTFDLPPPYTHVDFVTIGGSNPVQLLCAMQLSGGFKGANAGGYCHRSVTDSGPRSDVWFSDDMTPRLDWTWTAGNFFASASLRFFCRQRCICTSDTTPKPIVNEKAVLYSWQFLPGHQLTQFPDGSLYLQVPGKENQKSSVQVLPPQNGIGSSSGTCGVNGTDFCPYAWDEQILGPPPSAPPNTTDIIKPLNSNNATVCGNTCRGPADCGSTGSDGYKCSCAFPSLDDARRLGLDPVLPAAACLALFITAGQSRLGGRDTRELIDARGLPHTCKCNDTSASVECCGAVNGLRPVMLKMHYSSRTREEV